ncbi:low temperature-induced protein [Gracilibacillus oryzae]|uniref:Low temperature-induced protein n=1 Tax=Gracilibacillus oryzae TaxID=1672701 RepID=A0A7C8GWJ4_9BACI|nr:general stress protein [Gracilibacillus oryzae]KAB8139079.1 low temperature-induced protein [Gracilibacillus oryzae]
MAKEIIGGVFRKEADAVSAVKELQTLGYGHDHLTISAKDKDEVKDIKDRTGADVKADSSERGKNAGKGLGIGAGTGGVLGGLAALVAEAGLFAIPGIGPAVAAGPLAATITGLVGGGLVGALVGAGIPKEHAKEYEQYLKDGYILVLVETTGNQNDVYRTFTNNRTENTHLYPNDVVMERRKNGGVTETRGRNAAVDRNIDSREPDMAVFEDKDDVNNNKRRGW